MEIEIADGSLRSVFRVRIALRAGAVLACENEHQDYPGKPAKVAKQGARRHLRFGANHPARNKCFGK
ncbi:hypothetical protein ANCDUO_05148 [Ancylostoma duodenale]|uniref:Uncharacterized protein n=1 Tax=Ancylostoma duodenale TaxID=51022 RepID=A0A0C2DPE2_9BILA|nr:hypothetical protein ANCDUO_05148 [Ancylostoma duodenale]